MIYLVLRWYSHELLSSKKGSLWSVAAAVLRIDGLSKVYIYPKRETIWLKSFNRTKILPRSR
jgi:hypothetical protein